MIMAGAADLDGALDDLVVVGAVEGELAAEQQEHDDAHRPQVRLLAVAQLHQHLSREGEKIRDGHKISSSSSSLS